MSNEERADQEFREFTFKILKGINSNIMNVCFRLDHIADLLGKIEKNTRREVS